MEETIFKYECECNDYFTLELPMGAEIISGQAVLDRFCLWAIVNPDNKTKSRRFRMAGTGHPLGPLYKSHEYKFISTIQLAGGTLVFHLFEII